MVISTTKPRLTYEDYLNIPGDDRYELIDGELILVGSPNRYHQTTDASLGARMYFFVEENDMGWIFHAPFDVLLTDPDGSLNVVQPDLIFVSRERESIITPANIQGAPDLLVEILSPSPRRLDMTTKQELYARHGVKEYWIADPDAQTIAVMLLRDGKYETVGEYGVQDTLVSPTLEGFFVSLDSIFRQSGFLTLETSASCADESDLR